MSAAVLKFYNEIHEGHWEERGAGGSYMCAGGDEQWREDRGAKKRQKLRRCRQRERERERARRETKGMWSSPSLCWVALWLKRGAPGERGGSGAAHSVLLLPWSPACRPQKHTAKNLQEGLPFYCAGSPVGSVECAKQAQIVMALSTSQFGGRRSASDELPRGILRKLLFFLMF